jgi:hypothetical protein
LGNKLSKQLAENGILGNKLSKQLAENVFLGNKLSKQLAEKRVFREQALKKAKHISMQLLQQIH